MPSKLMTLFRAKAGRPRAQFVERCEDRYVPLISQSLPFVQCQRRHYVTDERSPALVAAGSPFVETGLDMIAEWVIANNSKQTDMDRSLTDPDIQRAIRKIEAELFDTAHVERFAVETVHAPPVPLAPRPAGLAGPPAIRTFVLLQKNPTMSRRQFVDHYENGHVPLVLKHLARDGVPLFATYVRNYPARSDMRGLAGPFAGDQASYDALSEMCYWSEADAEAFAPCMTTEAAIVAFARENEIMLKPDGFRMVQVETYGGG